MGLQNTPQDPAIFDQGLDVAVISVYLSCCGLAAEGVDVTRTRLISIWNDSGESLDAGLEILLARNIIGKATAGGEAAFTILPKHQWMSAM